MPRQVPDCTDDGRSVITAGAKYTLSPAVNVRDEVGEGEQRGQKLLRAGDAHEGPLAKVLEGPAGVAGLPPCRLGLEHAVIPSADRGIYPPPERQRRILPWNFLRVALGLLTHSVPLNRGRTCSRPRSSILRSTALLALSRRASTLDCKLGSAPGDLCSPYDADTCHQTECAGEERGSPLSTRCPPPNACVERCRHVALAGIAWC